MTARALLPDAAVVWRWLAVLLAVASAAGGAIWHPPLPLTIVGIVGGAVTALVSALERERWAALIAGLTLATCAPMARAAHWGAERNAARAWLDSHQGAEGALEFKVTLNRDAAIERDRVWVPVDVHAVGDTAFDPPFPAVLSVSGTLAVDRLGDWTRGRRLRAVGGVTLPAIYRNFGSEERWPHLSRPTLATLSVKSAALVEVVARAPPWTEALTRVRAAIRYRVTHALRPHGEAGAPIALALLLGERAALEPAVVAQMQRAGIYHVMALSGGNVALILLAITWLRHVYRPARRAWALGAAALLVFYAALVSAEPSVVRAIAVAALYLVAVAADVRAKAVHVLAVVAILMLLMDPSAVFDLGAWLTFVATLGLVALSGPVLAVLSRIPVGLACLGRSRGVAFVQRGALAVLSASLGAELVLWPLSAHAFGQVSLLGPLLNLAAIPLAAAAQFGAGLIAACGATAPSLVVWGAHLAVAGLLESARVADAVPMLAVDLTPPSLAAVGSYYASLTGWIASARRWRAWNALFMTLASVALVMPTEGTGRGELVMTTFDVGQGDATLLQFPSGHAMLVDGGGRVEDDVSFGERVLRPAVLGAGVRRLTHVVFSHGDPDHIGGLPAAIARLRPLEVWEGIEVEGHGPIERVRSEARRVGAAWRRVQAGDEVVFGDVRVSVVHPEPADWQRVRVRNDDSVVLVVRYGTVVLVLPGDIGHEVERRVATRALDGAVRIAKIPHHGSRTSSSTAWVQWTRPALAIASAGVRNRFGHPAAEVVNRYTEASALVLRTDQEGGIRVRTDGQQVRVETVAGRRFTVEPSDGRDPQPP